MLLLGAALVSCEKVSEQENPQEFGQQIRFSSSIGNYSTKVADDAFENGDVIGLIATEPINVEGVRLTWNGDGFTPEQPIYWGKHQVDPTTFVAWYPYELIRYAQPGSTLMIPTDQSKEETFKSIDYLGAINTVRPGNTVHLGFVHIMSRMNLVVRSEAEVAGLLVGGLTDQGFVDMEKYEIYASQSPAQIEYTPLAIGNGAYSLITLPQTAEVYVKVLLADGSVVELNNPATLAFESGKQINATVSLTPAKEVTFTAEIADWGQGASTEFASSANHKGYTVVVGNTYYPMSDLGDGLYWARIYTDGGSLIEFHTDFNDGYIADDDYVQERWSNLYDQGSLIPFARPIYGNGTFDIYLSAARKQFKVTEFEAKSPNDYGIVMDDIMADFVADGPVQTWPVYFEKLIDSDADVYKVTGYPLCGPYASRFADSYLPEDGIILDGRNPDKAFIAYSPMGLSWGGLPVYFYSPVEENGYYYDTNYYGTFGNGEFWFPVQRSIRAYFPYYDDWYSSNKHGQTVFVLPGYERSTYFVSDAYPYLQGEYTLDDGTKVERISLTLLPDNTLLRVGVFEGWLYEDDEEELEVLAKAGSAPFAEYDFWPNEETTIDIALETAGKYTVATYTEGADGEWYWWYRRFSYLPDGAEAPEFSFNVSDVRLSDIAPESQVIFTVSGEDINSVRACWFTLEDATDFKDISEDDLFEILDTESHMMDSFKGDETTYTIYGLEPGKTSVVLLEIKSIFNQVKATYFTVTTEPDPAWTSIGTGKYFDLGVPGIWYYDEEYDELGYSSPVEILKAEGNADKYRVMRPFHKLWNDASESLLAYQGTDAADHFDFYLIPDEGTNYIIFSDYSSGFRYPGYDDTGTLIYHYAPAYTESPASSSHASLCCELEEGVFGISPLMLLEGTRYHVDNSWWTKGIFVCLPGYDYTSPWIQTDTKAPAKAKSALQGPSSELIGFQPRIRPAKGTVTVTSNHSEKQLEK